MSTVLTIGIYIMPMDLTQCFNLIATNDTANKLFLLTNMVSKETYLCARLGSKPPHNLGKLNAFVFCVCIVGLLMNYHRYNRCSVWIFFIVDELAWTKLDNILLHCKWMSNDFIACCFYWLIWGYTNKMSWSSKVSEEQPDTFASWC